MKIFRLARLYKRKFSTPLLAVVLGLATACNQAQMASLIKADHQTQQSSPAHLLGGFGAYNSTAMSAVGNTGLSSVMDYISVSGGFKLGA